MPLTLDPRVRNVRAALIRLRDAHMRELDELDAAIAAWDALDDDRIETAQRGIADARSALASAR